MAYRFQVGEMQVECDTVDEVKALGTGGTRTAVTKAAKSAKPAKTAKKKPNPKVAKAQKANWAAARKMAKAEGISLTEARTKLAKAKK